MYFLVFPALPRQKSTVSLTHVTLTIPPVGAGREWREASVRGSQQRAEGRDARHAPRPAGPGGQWHQCPAPLPGRLRIVAGRPPVHFR